ncbi:helix-turn-helix domain-containing protein [Mycobacterium simiae]|uniref:Helix-turn-helix domain-containing protein n=1 Tax=Mycobacterium simiae TaxID=1784 RepID=A0A5B1B4S9_MYCSI|nr:helix-turn-helix domain-containing protein [Mycobacterium simiae]KAA1243112.1 helix-turn-helix domain-containing protein [Mycobacterium simiae]
MSGDGLTVINGCAVILSGHMLRVARDAVLIAERARRANGLPTSRAYQELAQALNAALSVTRQNDVAQSAVLQHYPQTTPTVTVEQAAAALGLSRRQTQRLAPRLGGRLIGGRWLVDEQALREHLEGKSCD